MLRVFIFLSLLVFCCEVCNSQILLDPSKINQSNPYGLYFIGSVSQTSSVPQIGDAKRIGFGLKYGASLIPDTSYHDWHYTFSLG